MTLTRKDAAATVFTALAVLVFAATHEGWNVWLVGDSHRWAAGAVFLLGVAGCSSGSPQAARWRLYSVLGTLALVLGALALATGSLTWLSLLVADVVLMWAAATMSRVRHRPARPIAT